MIKLKRVYEPPSESDGRRVLVERLWPRGVKKEEAKIHIWMKDIAPSHQLRRWFSHDPEKFEEFKERYIKELENKEDLLLKLVDEAKRGTLTLIYSAKDEKHNSAVVLKEVIEKMLTSPPPIR
ncbi:MAG: DUF488 domain-containing protein [Hydrogenobacter thermophilus]|uniref:DUF488 domain-containing protein n=1 Tax=Hydrogenobacter thermophilus TaxID=940 RepID=UPI001C76B04B|nr:DUF488 domain-containing protein [Hydrogenobacter thermophilus]QWK19136.1 MAG: DUF488 domain-containing protein [Hydrogenobacter thermophilus]